MTTTRLTDRQRQILDYAVTYFADHGQVPSLREIGRAVAIRSTNGVMAHLQSIARKGYLDTSNVGTLKSRAYRIIRLSDGTPVAAALVPISLLSTFKSCAPG